MGDSGATRTLLTPKAARPFERKVSHPQDAPLEVVYGGKERPPTVSKVQIDELEALVVPDLHFLFLT